MICRIGPYITAETDFGGFPYWISTVPNVSYAIRISQIANWKQVQLRRMNPAYIKLVDRYLDNIMPLLSPLQYSQGGPIIDFQIEDDTDTSISVDDTHKYCILNNYMPLVTLKIPILCQH